MDICYKKCNSNTQSDWFPEKGKKWEKKEKKERSLEDTDYQNCQFWPKFWSEFFRHTNRKYKWPNMAKFREFQIFNSIEYDFLKEQHQNNFHTKQAPNAVGGGQIKKTIKTSRPGNKWPKSIIKWPKSCFLSRNIQFWIKKGTKSSQFFPEF